MSLLIHDVMIEGSRRGSVLLEHGRIAAVGDHLAPGDADRVVPGHGAWLLPGLVDIGTHLPLDGRLAGELRAAAAAGVTTVLCPPAADAPLDDEADVRDFLARSNAGAPARAGALGALTVGLRGEGLTSMAALREAGCVAVDNGPAWIRDSRVMRCAMLYAAELDLPLLIRPVDPWLAAGGCAHAGRVATRLGLAGVPVVAETTALARDLTLVRDTGARVHFGPLSSAAAISQIAEARAAGLPVTADTAIHHLFLTELDVMGYDANCRVDPPLRSQDDREALRRAVADGLLSVRSDHLPLPADAKAAPFPAADPGIASLPTLLGLALRLLDEGLLDGAGLVQAFCRGPARALGLQSGQIAPGAPADLVLLDADAVWQVDPADPAWPSCGDNTPFAGWELRGRVLGRCLAGAWAGEEGPQQPELSAGEAG